MPDIPKLRYEQALSAVENACFGYSLKRLDDLIRHETVAIRGIPQVVCQVPLEGAGALNMPQLDIGNIFERILIGPCQYPDQIRMALSKAFHDHGVTTPRIDVSNIPLRR